MRSIALCLCLVWFGCERPTGADSNSDPKEGTAPTSQTEAEPIRDLPQVDTSMLDESSRALWADLINELLSPCGDPVSVARCVAEGRKCKKCVPAARFVTRLVDEGFQRAEIRGLYRLRYDPETEVRLTSKGAPFVGAPMAPVTIYEFADFQCPACKQTAPFLKRLVDEFPGRVRVVFKHFPLSGHPYAMDAAMAAVAASDQGKFWEMHDVLFEHQDALQPENLDKYAMELGLDMAKFRTAMKSDQTRAQIEADKAEGMKAGVDGTPSVFVSGRRYQLSPDTLSLYVREELDQ